jgi:hypothetical protein
MYAPFSLARGCRWKGKTKMLRKKWFPTLTKQEILRMRGGPKHNFRYSLGISESLENEFLTDVMELKLVNQKGSQRSPAFPEGYEPFEGSYYRQNLCLETMTILMPRLVLSPTGWPAPIPTPRIVWERKAACVLARDPRAEAFHYLGEAGKAFEVKQRIRRYAVKSNAALDMVLSLLAHRGSTPLSSDRADRFEACLCLQKPELLQDLRALLEMPDPVERQAPPGFPKAA